MIYKSYRRKRESLPMKKLVLCILSLCILLSTGCNAGSKKIDPVRPAAVAGQFYPEDSAQLRLAVQRYMENAVEPVVEKPTAVIVPHAGYVYSGQITADALRQAADYKYDLIIVFGTNHRVPDFNDVSIYAKGGFQTPLGIAEIDEDAAASLLAADEDFVFDPHVHAQEHSVEVVIPFLQYLFPETPILPLIVGSPDMDLCRKLGQAIADLFSDQDILIIASSDLSHYPDFEDARKVDRETLKAVATMDPSQIRSVVRREITRGTPSLSTCACGEGPILTAVYAARALGAGHGTVISYANSGDVSVGEYTRVVGYGAVTFSPGPTAPDTSLFQSWTELPVDSFKLNQQDHKALLVHARKTIEWYLTSGTMPLNRGFNPMAETKTGAFVTLHKHGELRGCIGHMAEDMPLCRTVGGMAVMAAFNDRRFRPVTENELDEIDIEISVLTPMKSVPDTSYIVVGRDGVVIRKGGRSAVYLPQVAPEQGWDREEMLSHLCQKAGLPPDGWKKGAEFLTFQAEVFSESDF